MGSDLIYNALLPRWYAKFRDIATKCCSVMMSMDLRFNSLLAVMLTKRTIEIHR